MENLSNWNSRGKIFSFKKLLNIENTLKNEWIEKMEEIIKNENQLLA